MAQVEESGSGKSANVELNLVPFIDLMCVCITFLLITAVWAQVSMIQLGTSIYGKKAPDIEAEPPKQILVAFRMDMKETGYVLNIGKQIVRIPRLPEGFDDVTLLEELQKIKETYPDKTDAVISVADSLSYERMVQGMDYLLEAGFYDIGVATNAVR